MDDNTSVETGSRFLASTLHEVRTPIQTIISTVELLEDTPLNKEQTEYVHQIEFSANSLLQLANDVLDFTKIHSDQFKLENIPYDVAELTERVVDLISMEAFDRNIEVITDIDYSVPRTVMGDPNRVQQIILNLVKNAVKFTEQGFILIRLSQVKNYLLFEIADSGIGIPDDKKKLIFNDFYQVDSSTTKRYPGTGLGLSICKNLVSVMKGKIGVLSNPSGGSNFWFAIPLEISNINESEKLALENVPKNTKILVVEDNPLALKALTRKLEILGIKNYECSAASKDALLKLQNASQTQNPFTLALIDLTMPKIDGWKLGEAIKKNPQIKNLKLYLMIPEGQMAKDTKLKVSNWFKSYIYKPIKITQLIEILKDAIYKPLNIQKQKSNFKFSNSSSKKDFSQIAKDNKILIAEDHPVNRKLLQIILEKFGATIFLAENGEIAVEQISKHPEIDIIFMDIFMPIKSGIDTTVEIRQKGYKGIIIACTANNNPADFETYSELGINDILLKPFKREAVQQMLDKWNTVLLVPEAKDIMNLIDINNQSRDLWDIADFIDTAHNDFKLAQSLMADYINQTTKILNDLKLELSAKNKNYKNIELYTHTLKGSSASVSVKKLAEIGRQMNEAAKQKDFIKLEAGRTEFAIEFKRLQHYVEIWKSSI